MIYCTMMGHITVSSLKLYEEWTGHYPVENRITSNTFTVIARDTSDKSIVGAAQITVFDDPVWDRRWGLIENVYVLRKFRRERVGRKLMKFMETEAQGLGCSFIKLTSRKAEGKALYRTLGYEEGSSFRKDL